MQFNTPVLNCIGSTLGLVCAVASATPCDHCAMAMTLPHNHVELHVELLVEPTAVVTSGAAYIPRSAWVK